MDFDKLPDEIFDLLAIKSYEELSAAEMEMVDQSIGADEYKAFRIVISDFQEVDQSLGEEVRPLAVNLAKPKTTWQKIVTYPIPAYQVAAGILILIFALLTLPEQTSVDKANSIDVKNLGKGVSISNDNYPDSLVFEL